MVLLSIILAFFYYNYKNELLEQANILQENKSIDILFNDLDLNDPMVQRKLNIDAVDMSKLIGKMEDSPTETLPIAVAASEWKRIVLDTLDSFPVHTTFALGNLLIFLFVVVQANEVSPKPQPNYTSAQIFFNRKFDQYWIILLFILNCFVLLDPLFRVICLGWKFAFKPIFFIFEAILSVTAIIILAINIFDPKLMSLEAIKLILLLRLARFLKWVYSFEKYKLFVDTLFKMFLLFGDLLAVLVVVIYFYITTAEVMFGGYLKTNSPIHFDEYGDPEYYLYINFNDFYMGLYTCFHLLIVNNWLNTSDMHCRVMGNFSYRIFFVSYYIIVVSICFNILIAFTLDVFITQVSNKSSKDPVPNMTDSEISDSRSRHQSKTSISSIIEETDEENEQL